MPLNKLVGTKHWKITYTDVIHADSVDDAMEILFEQLSLHVRDGDLVAFNIEEIEQ